MLNRGACVPPPSWDAGVTSRPRPDADYRGIAEVVLLGFGTILDDDETVHSQRVIDTAGPGVAVAYHAFFEQRDPRLDGFRTRSDSGNWRTPPRAARHLEFHSGHLIELNAIDREVVTGDAMSVTPLTSDGHELPARLEYLAWQCITNVAFQPMGDVERDFRTFAAAAGLPSCAEPGLGTPRRCRSRARRHGVAPCPGPSEGNGKSPSG